MRDKLAFLLNGSSRDVYSTDAFQIVIVVPVVNGTLEFAFGIYVETYSAIDRKKANEMVK